MSAITIGYSKAQQIGKRFIPKQKDRTKITKKEYEKAVEEFGSRCHCMSPNIEMHHIKLRSDSGKGTYRNLIPLCASHHRLTHTSSELIKGYQNMRETLYGEYYWCDKYDLFKLGMIEDPNDEEFEAFMKSQEYDEVEIIEPKPQFPF